jgi:hypothetical protein
MPVCSPSNVTLPEPDAGTSVFSAKAKTTSGVAGSETGAGACPNIGSMSCAAAGAMGGASAGMGACSAAGVSTEKTAALLIYAKHTSIARVSARTLFLNRYIIRLPPISFLFLYIIDRLYSTDKLPRK